MTRTYRDQELARLGETICEGLPAAEAGTWPARFAVAMRPGADLSMVTPRFLLDLLTAPGGAVHAKPAYEALPANVRDLLAATAEATADLHQLPDLSMPWPDNSGALREFFDKIPAEVLAQAARTIHNLGHWYPSDGDLEVPGRNAGAHWKFAAYADRSLRGRLGLPESGDRFHHNSAGIEVHEGAIRVYYSSRDTWTWHEVMS